MYKEVEGNLITLALEGKFDVITHGCNCFCTMGAGIAVPMAETFGCDQFACEEPQFRGDINKLGNIVYQGFRILPKGKLVKDGIFAFIDEPHLMVVNSYTQYHYGRNHEDGQSNPLDYEALGLCLRKINHIFKGKHVGLPAIGSGLAGGDWNKIKKIIQTELKDCSVTIVIFKENTK